MVYLVEVHDIENNKSDFVIVQSIHNDLEHQYKNYVKEKANEFKITINLHWLNIMNHENHHPHLTKTEYKKLEKTWNKFLKKNDFLTYVVENKLGEIIEYKKIII